MKPSLLLIAAVTLLAGCAATNAFVRMTPDYSDLPVEDVKAVARSIEAIVAEGSETFTIETAGGIQTDTPEVLQAVRTRAIRKPLITEFLDGGFGIEEANGLIAIQRSSAYKRATTRGQRDREALLVMSENNNRWTIYEGLLKANNWPPSSLSAIQAIFFEARIAHLTDGQQHEAPAAE